MSMIQCLHAFNARLDGWLRIRHSHYVRNVRPVVSALVSVVQIVLRVVWDTIRIREVREVVNRVIRDLMPPRRLLITAISVLPAPNKRMPVMIPVNCVNRDDLMPPPVLRVKIVLRYEI